MRYVFGVDVGADIGIGGTHGCFSLIGFRYPIVVLLTTTQQECKRIAQGKFVLRKVCISHFLISTMTDLYPDSR